MSEMKRQTVVSSNIAEVGHRADTLFIKFNSGGVYSYQHVALHYYNLLLSSESVGKAFHQHIKNHFVHKKLNEDVFA